jgi:urease accessory protein
MAIAAAFALVHGYAHGLEMPLAASPAHYAMGFMLATVWLHGVGIAGRLIGRRTMQAAGAGIAVGGLALVLGV